MQVKFLEPMETEAGRLPVGTLVEHPDCFLLADKGHAATVDEEAHAALDKWRREKPKPGEEDKRPYSWSFAGRDVPTVFTLPTGERLTVTAGVVTTEKPAHEDDYA